MVRSPFVETFFGKTIVHSLQNLKYSFDPDNLLNPHKIVYPGPIDHSLRYQSNEISKLTTGFVWEPEGILAAAEKCNGAAACRKLAGTGTMCPSYMATLEEQHSTRGRANTIRQVLQEQRGFTQQSLPLLKNSLQFCLSCKACHAECPANVDMAKLKAEYLYQSHKLRGTSIRTKLLSKMDTFSYWGSRSPAISNALFQLPLTKNLLGFSPKRPLPALVPATLSRWYKTHSPHSNAGTNGKVVILNDFFSEYYDKSLGRCTVELLERWGFKVTLSPCFASIRLSISLGLLEQARTRLTTALKWIRKQLEENLYIIGLEPSELLTYRDEAKSLLINSEDINTLEKMQNKTLLFDEFVSENKSTISGMTVFKDQSLEIAVHIHCHQKALSDQDKCMDALQLIPNANIQAIPSGCCGMAGLFGYGKQNYDLSAQIGESVLLPFIRELPTSTKVVATGASCRQQIQDFLKITAYHPAKIIHQQLAAS